MEAKPLELINVHLDVEYLCNQVADYLKRTDLSQRWRGVCLMQQKIYGVMGGVIEQCKDLIREVMLRRFYDFRSYREDYMSLPGDGSILWKCFDWFDEYWEKFQLYEGLTKEQYNEGVAKVEMYGLKKADINNPLKEYYRGGSFQIYYEYHDTPEYRLFRQLCNLSGSCVYLLDFSIWIPLYIALQTEKEKIKDEAAVQGVQLTETATNAPGLPQEVFTDRAKKYFAKAIGAGLMKQDGNNYTWLHNGRRLIELAYFLQKIYNPDGTGITPFKQLEQLFGVKNLTQTTSSLNDRKKTPKWRPAIEEIFTD